MSCWRTGLFAWGTRMMLTVLVSSALVLTPQATPGVEAVPTANPSSSDPSDGSAELADAARTGDPVLVDDWTTETSEVEALPSGQFKATISAAPARIEEGGEWHELDPTLERRPDGMLEPRVAIGEVVISGGGAAGSTLAQVSADGSTYTLRAPFTLPAPTLHDDTAVYADVLPDVDLVTTAGTTGFSFNWVVKSREAADDPRVRKLSLPVDLDGLTALPENGGFSYTDKSGVRRFWTPMPTMWDSSGAPSADPASGDSAETSLSAVDDGPDMADRVTGVAATVDSASAGSTMTLTPDTALLDAPDVVFPVVIDPTVKYPKTRNGWTAVWNNFPSKSFWQTDHSLGAGYEGYEQFKVVRSYFRFDTSPFRGARVLNAELNVRQIHQASCQARTTDVYRTATIGTGTTWNNQPARYDLQGSNSSTAGCGSGTAMVEWSIDQGARELAATNAATGTFMIRARDEGDKIAWKQFDDAEANIEVYYVNVPVSPSGVTLAASGTSYPCGTVTAPTMIGSTTVTLGVKVSTADPPAGSATMLGVFARANATAGTVYGDYPGSGVYSGGTSTLNWSVPNGHVARFRAKARTTYTYNGTAGAIDSAAHSPTWCYFKVDTSAPPPPDVTSTAFEECASAETPDDCTALGTAGTPGGFTVSTTATDAVSYRWSLNGSAAVSVATSGGAARTITVTPTDVMNVLSVWSADGAGNLSLKKTFVFKVEPRSPEVQWSFDSESLGADTGREQDAPLTTDSAVRAEVGRVGQGLTFTGGAPAEALGPGVSATNSFTSSAWVRVENPAAGTTTTLLSALDATGNVFEFGYEPGTSRWTAGRRISTTSVLVGSATGTAVLRVWTHLAATYEATSRTLTFYVNGRSVGSTVYPSVWLNRQGWRIGCGRVDGNPSSCGVGEIDEVNLYTAVLGADEIRNLADPTTGEKFHPIAARSAEWSMNDADDSAVAEDTCFDADLTIANAPTPRFGPTADTEDDNRALLLLGAPGTVGAPSSPDQQVKLSRPVVDSTGSFTIGVNVRPTVAKSMVIAQQVGVNRESWTLALKHDASAHSGRWVFQRTTADSTGATVVEVRSPAVVDLELISQSTGLIATYDRRHDRIALFVNGQEYTQGPTPATDEVHEASFTAPWAARGELRVGYGVLNGSTAVPFSGEIERVDLFAGSVDSETALTYHKAVVTTPNSGVNSCKPL